MEDKEIMYGKFQKYKKVTLFKDDILLQNKINCVSTSFSQNTIIKTICNYGKKLYNILGTEFLQEYKIDKEKENIVKCFLTFFSNIGYYKVNEKDITIEQKELVFVSFDTLKQLTIQFIRYYLIYELYTMLDKPPLKKSYLIKINTYMKSLNSATEEITVTDYDKLYNSILELISNLLDYNLSLNYNFIEENKFTFTITSNDFYSLALYSFCKVISLKESERISKFFCAKCHKIYTRSSNNQKYCYSCKKQIYYGKNLDNHKLEILEKIADFSTPNNNYYPYWNSDFQQKYNSIVALSKKSRKRLETPISDLKNFYQEVLDKVALNKHPYKRSSK